MSLWRGKCRWTSYKRLKALRQRLFSLLQRFLRHSRREALTRYSVGVTFRDWRKTSPSRAAEEKPEESATSVS